MITAVLLFGFAASFGNQDDKAVEEAIEAFKSAIKSPSEAERVTAVIDLSKVHHAKTLARIASLLSSDGPTVRIAAAKGLSQFSELKKQAANVLIAALGVNAKETTVVCAIYESIGKLEEPSSLGALHRGTEEKDLSIAKAAISATGAVGNAASIDPLIALLAKMEKLQKSAGGGIDYTAPSTSGGTGVTVRSDDNPGKRATELGRASCRERVCWIV